MSFKCALKKKKSKTYAKLQLFFFLHINFAMTNFLVALFICINFLYYQTKYHSQYSLKANFKLCFQDI